MPLEASSKYQELLSLLQIYLLQEREGLNCFSPPPFQAYFNKSMPLHPAFNPSHENKTPIKEVAKAPPPPSPIQKPEKLVLPPQENKVTPSLPAPPPVQKHFYLEPLKEIPAGELSEWKMLFKQIPDFTLCDSIPDDALAKKKMGAWKAETEIPPIVLLSFSNKDAPMQLLKNIAKAISLHFKPARALPGFSMESKNQWEQLFNQPHMRLIIASDCEVYTQKNLMKHYQEAAPGKHQFSKVPLLLLSDLDLYLKQPQLKPLLWRAICKELGN